jgi:hypothetical protein
MLSEVTLHNYCNILKRKSISIRQGPSCRDRMVVLHLPVQSVLPITTNVVSFNPTRVSCTPYNIM